MTHIANYRLQQGNLSDLTRPWNNAALVGPIVNGVVDNPIYNFDITPSDVCVAYMNQTSVPRLNTSTMSF